MNHGHRLEHVFHLANALSSVVRMAKTGGRIIHISPMSNCADHGFYSFSPALFVDYYSINRLAIQKNRLCPLRPGSLRRRLGTPYE